MFGCSRYFIIRFNRGSGIIWPAFWFFPHLMHVLIWVIIICISKSRRNVNGRSNVMWSDVGLCLVWCIFSIAGTFNLHGFSSFLFIELVHWSNYSLFLRLWETFMTHLHQSRRGNNIFAKPGLANYRDFLRNIYFSRKKKFFLRWGFCNIFCILNESYWTIQTGQS